MMSSMRSVLPSRVPSLERLLRSDPDWTPPESETQQIDLQTVNLPLLKELVAAYLEKFDGSEPDGVRDAWMAPRIHAALRLTRAVAARPEIWSWLALVPMRSYMKSRWPLHDDIEERKTWRYFSSNLLRNGVARLWWAAEMLRDGPDYTLAECSLEEVYRFQFISELKYSWHKECCRAFARVLDDRNIDGGGAKNLSKRINVYLGLRAWELDDCPDSESVSSVDESWLLRSPSLAQLTCEVGEIVGPRDGFSRGAVEEGLYDWIDSLAATLDSDSQ